MRAWEYDRYGRADVLQLRSVAAPVAGRGQLVVRVRAAALNPKDGLFRRGLYRRISGSRFPKRTGCDWAGEVLSVGEGVSGWQSGQKAWGTLNEYRFERGSLAEQALTFASECGPLPKELSFEEAAGIPLAAQTSLQALRDVATLSPGDAVLIHGASGGVGVFALQIARALGAAHVTSTSSPGNFELCRALGADETLDYETGEALRGKHRYRVVFDAMGNLSFGAVCHTLQPRGRYVSTVPSLRLGLDIARTVVASRRAGLVAIRSRTGDLEALAGMISDRKLRPVVDQIFDFEDAQSAFARLESRRARGKIIVRIP